MNTITEIEKLASKIKVLESELEALKRSVERGEALKNKPLELETGTWISCADGVARLAANAAMIPRHQLRKTKEQAEQAAKQALRRDILAAWVCEHSGHDGSWRSGFTAHCILKSIHDSYRVYSNAAPYLGLIYMSEGTAEWLCEKLNNGEIVLP